MKLFELKNHSLTISEEAYVLRPFKAIWERDTIKDKERALAELGYIFYMEDYRSDFSDILDEGGRKEEVIKSLAFNDAWKEDELVRDARRFYRSLTDNNIALQYLIDAKQAVNKLRELIRTVDLLATDKRGKLVNDATKISNIVSNSGNLLRNLTELEKEVKKGLERTSEIRGGREKAIMEDGA